MNPTKVFAVLAAIVLAIVAIFFLTRPDTAAPPAEPRTPDFSLTDTEAITRFEQLDEMRQRAYFDRDPSLLSEIYTTSSPARERVLKDLRILRKDEALSRTKFKTKRLEVVSNTPTEIELLQVVNVYPKILTESGKNITPSDQEAEFTVEWTLHREGDRWLVHDSVVIKKNPLF